ncbi:MAG: hypothetical protein HUU10_12075 [Bacteroidetes bacterium]|nr:hypothetical protein [Bacteroidota bacterium]
MTSQVNTPASPSVPDSQRQKDIVGFSGKNSQQTLTPSLSGGEGEILYSVLRIAYSEF